MRSDIMVEGGAHGQGSSRGWAVKATSIPRVHPKVWPRLSLNRVEQADTAEGAQRGHTWSLLSLLAIMGHSLFRFSSPTLGGSVGTA